MKHRPYALILMGLMIGVSNVHAAPDLSKVWATRWIGLQIPVVQKGLASPSTDLDEKYLNPKASVAPEQNNDAVYWTGTMLLQTADKPLEIPKELRKKEALQFSSLEWKKEKEELRGVVGLAPAHTFVVADDEPDNNEFWIIEIYGDEKGAMAYLSVGYHCGANFYQQRMDTKFAYLVDQELIHALITAAKKEAKP